MKPFTPMKLALAISAQLALTAGVAPVALAQSEAVIEEVVVTGTRREARSVFESAAPIDVISGSDFVNQGGSDLTNLIRNLVPSYNVNSQSIADASVVIRPANMRGLAPDHTLVLVNGKRRHRASVIAWLGNGVSDGAQGPDISVIPAIALKQVEILRDGAAAQYGSDAIAGVMNFILKDASEGGSVAVKYGKYSENSENSYTISGNIGVPITSSGFLNASIEYSEDDETDRSVQRADAQALIDGGNTNVRNPAQIWGSPRVDDNVKTFFNFGLETSNSNEIYAFGNYASKEVDGGFFFRNPDTRNAVFSPDSGVTRLVGDVTGDLSGNCPTGDNGQPSLNVGDAAGLAGVIADPNCFVFNGQFPGGFTPRFGADTRDASLVVGTRGNLENGLNYDVSAGFGWNDIDFFIYNTVNSSLGASTPTNFDPGDYTQTEYNFNVELSYAVDTGLFASDLNIAAGFEIRSEAFEITAGQTESWDFGSLAAQGFSAGSNGFVGFSPEIAGDWDRTNTALYLDLETDVTERWLVGAAVRYEDFDDFGSTTNGKLSTHFTVTDWLAVRSTYSTGFRAPTPGQQNASNTSTIFEQGMLINTGTIPPSSLVAQQRGGKDLQEETSNSYTAGLVFQWENLSITADYYNIELSDRIAVSQEFTLGEQERKTLVDAGISGADNISTFQFFVNDLGTTGEGVDLVVTYAAEMFGGSTDFIAAWNHNETTVDDFDTALIDARRINQLESGLPENRVNLGATHLNGNWRFTLRSNWADGWYDFRDVDTYDGYMTHDLEVAYTFDNGLTLTGGGQNFTDETPDENKSATGSGNKYSRYAPLGYNGAYWYGRVSYDL
ncbi:MAG: TonB-dependent receptor plug domain-containing protein [Candidatus Azotimanducaceae bacterium WSBS_2022_MAG_OTU7]